VSADEAVTKLIMKLNTYNNQAPSFSPMRSYNQERKLKATIAGFSDKQVEELTLQLLDDNFKEDFLLVRLLRFRLENKPMTAVQSYRLAQALQKKRTQRLNNFGEIGGLLLAQQQLYGGLNDKTINSLLSTLKHQFWNNRISAIRVLTVVKISNRHFEEITDALLEILRNDESAGTRSYVLQKLNRDDQVNIKHSAEVFTSVVNTALSDIDMEVRLDAIELLITLDIDAGNAKRIAKTLSEAMIPPNHELWNHFHTPKKHFSRAVNALVTLHVAPYPEYVVKALMEAWQRHHINEAFSLLVSARQRFELADKYVEQLLEIAANDWDRQSRKNTYRMFFQPDSTSIDKLLERYSQATYSERVRAGIELQFLFEVKSVSPDQISQVEKLLFKDTLFTRANKENELRETASKLLTMYSQKYESKELVLANAVRQYSEDVQICDDFLALSFTLRSAELTVIKYADDQTLPSNCRVKLLRKFEKHATPEHSTEELEQLLTQMVDTSEDYYLVQTAADVLEALGKSRPLKAIITHRYFWGYVKILICLALLLILIIGVPFGFVQAAKINVGSNSLMTTLVKTGFVLFWLVLSACAALAVIWWFISSDGGIKFG
jgi:hypothetical protein